MSLSFSASPLLSFYLSPFLPSSPPPPLLLLLLPSSSSPGCSSIYSVSSWFWCPRSCLSSVTLSSPTSSSDSMYPSPPGGGWWGRVSFMWRLPWSPCCCLLIIHSGGQGTTPYRDSCGESLDCNVCVQVCIPAHTHTHECMCVHACVFVQII